MLIVGQSTVAHIMSKVPKVYIDGHVGTTGLRIRQWLSGRDDIELLTLPDELRKDASVRRNQVQSSDVSILCLPDDQSREAAAWVENESTRVIDASTAHRVVDRWVYGLPELQPSQRDAIRTAKLVSNPGCYASAFVLLVRPLVDEGILPRDVSIVIHALSGYSGGGRSLIERWEDPKRGLTSLPYEAPYAYGSLHKHIPEMTKYGGVSKQPQFLPAVGPFRCGMRVQVPLHFDLLNEKADGKKIWQVLDDRYQNEVFVDVVPLVDGSETDEQSFDPRSCNDTNRISIRMLDHPSGHATLMAIQDNLGKGACGMAIQSLNLMLDRPEETGLPV